MSKVSSVAPKVYLAIDPVGAMCVFRHKPLFYEIDSLINISGVYSVFMSVSSSKLSLLVTPVVLRALG